MAWGLNMDYRERNYYLVSISSCALDMRLNYFRIASPTLRIHSPYNHFKENKGQYDGTYLGIQGYNNYWQMMISCRKEDSDALEYELRKAKRNDGCYSQFLKLSKELCGQ